MKIHGDSQAETPVQETWCYCRPRWRSLLACTWAKRWVQRSQILDQSETWQHKEWTNQTPDNRKIGQIKNL